MTKQAGMGDNLYIDGNDVSGDIQSIQSVGGGQTPLPLTDITQSAEARTGGLLNGRADITVYFNDANNRAHATLKTLPTSSRYLTYCRGTTLGNAVASMVAKQVNYDWSRAPDGSLLGTVQALSSDGYPLEWGRQLTAGQRADTAATNGTGVDFTAVQPGAFGAQMYVHLTAFTGTSVTIKIQSSSDNGGADAWADVAGLTTGALTTTQGIRVAVTALTLERYLRVVSTGTFTVATFSVNLVRNETAIAY